MAVLYLDKNLEKNWKQEYNLTLAGLKILSIQKLPFGVEKIIFHSNDFGIKEPVLARLQNQGDSAIITIMSVN